ncbi:MAG: glycosyltransferase [Planctomycetaceae bacterium]
MPPSAASVSGATVAPAPRPAPLHVVLVALGSSGDVHPFIGLGRELRLRGHAVTLAAAGWFRDIVERAGLAFVDPCPEIDFVTEIDDPALWRPLRGTRLVLDVFARPLLEPVWRLVTESLAADRAAGRRTVVAASSLAFGARVARETHRFPLVTVHLSPVLVRGGEPGPRLPGLLVHRGPAWFRALQWGLADRLLVDRAIGRWLFPFRARFGLAPVQGIFRDWMHSPDRVLGLFPEWMASPGAELPAVMRLTGFPLYSEEGVSDASPEVTRFLAEGTPPILFTPGSANVHGGAFFAAAADACRRLGRRGLLLTRFPAQIPAALPPGVRHADFVPFRWLAPRSAALVHHGGVGTLAQGLAAGVPQVVMPMGFDQFDNAARLVRLGVGAEVPRRAFRGPRLAATLGALLDDAGVEARCGAVAERVRGADGIAAAAAEVEAIAGGA